MKMLHTYFNIYTFIKINTDHSKSPILSESWWSPLTCNSTVTERYPAPHWAARATCTSTTSVGTVHITDGAALHGSLFNVHQPSFELRSVGQQFNQPVQMGEPFLVLVQFDVCFHNVLQHLGRSGLDAGCFVIPLHGFRVLPPRVVVVAHAHGGRLVGCFDVVVVGHHCHGPGGVVVRTTVLVLCQIQMGSVVQQRCVVGRQEQGTAWWNRESQGQGILLVQTG